MASERVCDFNQRAQGLLEELEKAEPKEVAAIATSFVDAAVANGFDDRPELCRDFAETLARTVPDSATRAPLVRTLLARCGEEANSLTRQLGRIIGQDLIPQPS